jgi:hypothetical protein
LKKSHLRIDYSNETRTSFVDNFIISVIVDKGGMLKRICLNALLPGSESDEGNDKTVGSVVVRLSLPPLRCLLKSSAKNNKLTKTLRE